MLLPEENNDIFLVTMMYLKISSIATAKNKNNPSEVLYRADEPLMTPSEKYELEGYVPNVIFGESLVEFKGTYFYYYGAADKYVCVATVKKAELEKYLSSL